MATIPKIHISLVVIGHVDSGKSTTIGHLVYKCGGINKRKIEEIERESAIMGRASFKYAWILDNLKAERERGITIDISFQKIETPKFIFTIIDAPGHRDFIKNMITGTSQADVAILLIDSSPGRFESGWEYGGQTKEHTLLAYTLGVKQVIVAINKMDACDYSEIRYNEIKDEITNYMLKVGFKIPSINFVPICGWDGDNLIENSINMPWYKGPVLLETMDLINPPRRPIDKPLRLPLHHVYNIGGVGAVPAGRVESGVLRPGTVVSFAPPGLITEVRSLEMRMGGMEEAVPGDIIGFSLTSNNITHKDLHRGDVVFNPLEGSCTACESFEAHVVILSHPNEIRNGYSPLLHIHTASTAISFKHISQKMDRRTNKVLELDPPFVKKGDSCLVTMKPFKPLVVESFADFPSLGRFALRDLRQTVAVGVITSVLKEGAKKKGSGKKK